MEPVGTSVFISKKLLHSQAPAAATIRITSHSLRELVKLDLLEKVPEAADSLIGSEPAALEVVLVVDVFRSVTLYYSF